MKAPPHNSTALQITKDLLWAVAIAGMLVGVGRFVFGLGAATNMKDALPWGWWKVFNMVAGAALATSGFVVAAIIYIFQWKKYQAVARLSVVIGFLGYGSSLFSLLFDIGLPHRGWHPFFMWNPHSFLFEVFWCVSIYWGVTALELVPIVTERLPYPRLTHWIHEKILPVVVLGITLSTMHHSSLGSLFMVSPTRLYPLWHSYWIPPEFFISAMGAGLSTILLLMVIVSSIYGWQRKPKMEAGLAKGAAFFLGLYLLVKTVDFTLHGKWGFVFGPTFTWESKVFLVEILLQTIIPIVVLATPTLRRKTAVLVLGTSSAFVGLIMHRIDTGIVGYFRSSDAVYVPNLSELLLSAGVLSAATLVFFFLVERFHILDEPPEHHDEDGEVPDEPPPGVTWWSRAELREVLLGSATRRVVVIFVVVVPLTWFAFRGQATGAFRPVPQPVRGEIEVLEAAQERYRIDGDKDGQSTDFGHQQHTAALMKMFGVAEEDACIKCHHLDLPGVERGTHTACSACHRDMQAPTALAEFPENAPAPGYKDAMHGNCLTCHRLLERERGVDPASATSTGNCLFCHRQWADAGMEFAKELLAAPVVDAPAGDGAEPAPASGEDGGAGDAPGDGPGAPDSGESAPAPREVADPTPSPGAVGVDR